MKKRVTRLVIGLCTAATGIGGTLASQAGPVQAAQIAKPNIYAVFQGIQQYTNIRLGPGIEVDNLQFGMGNSFDTGSQTKGAGVGKLQFYDITFTKQVDLTTPAIMDDIATGRKISGDIYLQKIVNQQRVTYLHLHLQGVFTGESQGSGGDTPTESVSIAPSTLSYTYIAYNADGTPGPTLTFTWDAPSGQASLSDQ